MSETLDLNLAKTRARLLRQEGGGYSHDEADRLETLIAEIERLRAALTALHAAPSKEKELRFRDIPVRTDARMPVNEIRLERTCSTPAADPLASGGWQAIRSAPKDGTWIIARLDDLGVAQVRWHSDCDGWSRAMRVTEEHNGKLISSGYQPSAFMRCDFTHWMELPAPPLPAEPKG